MKNMQAVTYPETDYAFRANINAIYGLDGFHKIADFLQQKYGATVLEKFDGPDAHRWIMESDGLKMELSYDDPYGSSLIAKDRESKRLVRKISEDIRHRLENMNSRNSNGAVSALSSARKIGGLSSRSRRLGRQTGV